MDYILIILLISFLGPIIGSLIGVLKKPSLPTLYGLLSFSAGVMLAVSFIQLIPQSVKLSSGILATAGFGLGCILMFVLDRLLPHIHPGLCSQEQGGKLKRTAVFLLVGMFLHNFPEGLAMGLGAVTELKFSLIIALSLAIHDLPEGIATSAPYYYCTKNRLRAFLLSASTAIPTIIGFLLAYSVFPSIPIEFVGILSAATAGLMVYISVDELIPSSFNYLSHFSIFSLLAGIMTVMFIGLL